MQKKSLSILIIASLVIIIVAVFILLIRHPKMEPGTLKPHFGENETDYYIPDLITGHLHKPNASREFNWPEHPSGKMVMKTNNMGFREDENTKEVKADQTIRVLVTGDSHTDGVVYNNESFANRLEQLLNTQNQNAIHYEMINAGAGYYGPQNYRGLLYHYLNLKPDIFVVGIYTGNDFLDAIRIEVENGRMADVKRPSDYFNDLYQVDEKAPGFTGQLVNQIKFFKTFPNTIDTALQITEENFTDINTMCEKNQIQLLVLLIPSKVDVEPEKDAERIKMVKNILKFTDADLSINRKISLQFIQWLKKNKIDYIDLFDAMDKNPEELYWKADYHLSTKGHDAIARILFQSNKW